MIPGHLKGYVFFHKGEYHPWRCFFPIRLVPNVQSCVLFKFEAAVWIILQLFRESVSWKFLESKGGEKRNL